MNRVMVVAVKITLSMIVILSRFFSTIPAPSKVSTTPANRPETPPPLPACKSINNTNPKLAAICTAYIIFKKTEPIPILPLNNRISN